MLHSNQNAMVEAFQFSTTKQELRSVVINSEPWVVAKDVCNILGISKYRDVVSKLDDDERVSIKVDTLGGKQKMVVINESGLYALIFKSNKPEAKVFRKWVTSEVLPTLRKKGYYAMSSKKHSDFIDARAIPYEERELNGFNIRYLAIEGELWFSINDIHKAIASSTGAAQSAKKLNAVQTLAIKIQLFGNTHPAWFTNSLGFQLLLSGSRVLRDNRQLSLSFVQKGGE